MATGNVKWFNPTKGYGFIQPKMWRNDPKFVQRFEGKVNKDRKTIKGYWEKSFDGKKWEHDFDIKYTKRA